MKYSVILSIFLGFSQGSEILNRPSDSSDLGIDSDAFASASVQARIDADLEMDELAQKMGHMAAAQQNNKLWEKNFHNSEFYRKYKDHLADRAEKK